MTYKEQALELLHNSLHETQKEITKDTPPVLAKTRILCTEELFGSFCAIFDFLAWTNPEISTGKKWKVNNKDNFYVYIETRREYVQAIDSIQYELRELVLNSLWEGTQKGPTGEQTIQGTITKIFTRELRHNHYLVTDVTKCIIKLDNGTTAEGTLPKSIRSAEVGTKVQLSGTFKLSRKHTHSYYSYPRGAKIL